MINLLDVAAPNIPISSGIEMPEVVSFILGVIVGVIIVLIIKAIKNKKSN